MNHIKKFFNTPLKAVLSSAAIAGIVGILGTGTVLAANTIADSSSIGSENAQNFAFADAGIDSASAKVLRTEFDYEQKQFIYEVEFIADGIEYEYWIKADDGTVVKKETELTDSAKYSSTVNTQPSAPETAEPKAEVKQEDVSAQENVQRQEDAPKPADNTSEPAGSYIGVDSAKSTAAAHAGFSVSDVTFSKAKLENDDGCTVYEIEFYKDGMEYEYTLNATDGTIMEYDSEYDD